VTSSLEVEEKNEVEKKKSKGSYQLSRDAQKHIYPLAGCLMLISTYFCLNQFPMLAYVFTREVFLSCEAANGLSFCTFDDSEEASAAYHWL
jgi:hypothetical protein